MQLGFKAVNPSSSYMAHEVNQIWNWIKIKSKPNFFSRLGSSEKPQRHQGGEKLRKIGEK